MKDKHKIVVADLKKRAERLFSKMADQRRALNNVEKDSIRALFSTSTKYLKENCGIGQEIFDAIENSIIRGRHIGWHYALFGSGLRNLQLIIKLIYKANEASFIQIMSPMPSPKARYFPFTTTMLANLVGKFIQGINLLPNPDLNPFIAKLYYLYSDKGTFKNIAYCYTR